MANNKTTYTLEIDAEIGDLKRELENAKKAFTSLDGSNYAKGFDKKIGSMLSTLDKLQKKASQPIDSKATFASLEKGFGSVVVDAKNLLEELQKISTLTTKEKITLLPEGEQKKLKDAIAAVQDYKKAVDKAERTRIKNLEANKTKKAALEEDLKASKVNEASKKKAYKDATKKGSQYGDALAITQQAEAAKKAQKEIGELEKTLKKYKKELEELKKIENRTPEQEQALEIARSNVASVSGKIGARKKVIKNGPTETQVTAAEKIVADQSPTIDALQKEMVAAGKETTNLTNKIETLNQKIEDNSEVIVTSQSDYKVLYEAAKKLGVSLEGVGEDASPENVQLLTNRLFELVERGIKPIEDASNGASPSLKAIGEEAEKAGEKARSAEESFASLADNNNRISNLKQTIAQFVGWTGASKALSAALRNAFEATKELDKAMTEIAVVTDFEVGDMWDQLPEYTQRANELGISITSAYEASALFYQQGLDTNEMIQLSNETLKMARIAGLDAAEATDRMTAALRGFNMELDQASAQKVADVYSELAAITASDVDEISKAMTKTASIASSAGMEFETTAAFLSQIIETTRESAETAGTAMKTVIARFQELKKDPSEIGEVEGEIVDANAIETALRSVGVSLRDAGGQFRELDDVFLELSSKWNTLDKNTQRYIATIAAGSRQQSRFIAMMQDYERTQELVTAANNSAGASQRQYEKTLESLDTKLTRLANAWTEFSTGLMNSDLVKMAVDFLTGLLNALNKVTKGFEGFTGSLSKVGALIAIFQTAKVIVTKFFDGLIENIYSSAREAGSKISQGVKEGIEGEQSKQKRGGLGRLIGYSQAKAGAKQIAEARGLKIDKTGKEAEAWKREYNDALVKKNKLEEEGLSNTEEYTNAVKNLNEINERRVYTSAEAAQIEKEGFKQVAAGAQTAAQAVTMLGVGIGMVGQIFTNMGMEEVGENFQMVGNVITFLGSALMALVPIITLLGTTFTIAGTEITAAGIMAQIGWWPLLLITLAIVAVIGTVIAVANAIKKASPEYKLEKAQEAADKAASAADRAADAYENLVEQFEGLEEGYKALEDLTRGTEEWNKAVREINNSVLDLIQQYPELSKFVDNEGGVLTIDLDDESVQQVLKDAETSAVVASNSVMMANLNVARAEDDLAYKRLSDEAKFGLAGANLAYGAAMAGSIVAGAGAGAGIGAGIGAIAGKVAGGIAGGVVGGVGGAGVGAAPGAAAGSAAGGIGGTALGAIIGGVVGGIGGLIGGFSAAEAAKDAALEDTQKTTEALAKAIADGAIIDNGSGYEVKDAEKLVKYGLNADNLKDYYLEVGDSTEALRSFGNTLLETERQEEAAFGALAASAYSLANVLGMAEEEKEQAGNLVDDATVKKMYDEEMAKLGDQDYTIEEGSGAMDESERQARDEAIKAQYGADARIEGNKVIFRDAEGKQQEEELTSEEIKGLIVNQKVTNMAKEAVEIAPNVLDKVIEKTGLTELEVATTDKEGKNLTKAQADALSSESSTQKLKSAWDKLSTTEQAVFGTYDDYIAKTQGAAKIAEIAFENAQKTADKVFGEGNTFIKDFMTADMAKGFANKIAQVYEISGQQGALQIQAAYDELIEGKDEATAQEITALVNGVDWTNQESLLALQIQLEEQYGYTEKEAEAFCDTLGEAAKATSNLDTTVQIFGEFYQATQKVNSAMEKLSDLQWEYERMLKNGADATELASNLEEQRQQMLTKGNTALKAYEAAREDQAKIYASGVSLPNVGKDLTKYVNFDPTTGQYNVSELQRQIDAGMFGAEGSEGRKAVEDYVAKLTEANETAKDQLDIAKEAYEQLEELNEQAEEAYWSLYDQVEDLLLSELEKDISIQEEILEATESANEKLLNKLQEQIDEQRQARENEKTEQEIADLQKQAAYLGMDTSGVNALELLDLEKQIAEQEQAYQDSLVDQSLQSLQDANERAAEQREQQIALQQAQLDQYKNSIEFENEITKQLDNFMTQIAAGVGVTDTDLGGLIEKSEFYTDLHPGEETEFWKKLNETGTLANYWRTMTESTGEGGVLSDLLEGIQENTSVDRLTNFFYDQELAAANQHTSLAKDTLGFSFADMAGGVEYQKNENGSYKTDSSGNKIVDYNNNTKDYIFDMEGVYSTTTKYSSDIQAARTTAQGKYDVLNEYSPGKYLSEQDYYANMSEKDAKKLRDDLAAGNWNSELLWSNYVSSQYASFSKKKAEGFAGRVSAIVKTGKRDGVEGLWENRGSNGLGAIITERQKILGESLETAKDWVVRHLKYYGQIILDEGSIDDDGDDGWTKGLPYGWSWLHEDKEESFTPNSSYYLDGAGYTVRWNVADRKDKSFIDFMDPQDGWVAYKGDNLYAYNGYSQSWYPLDKGYQNGNSLYQNYVKKHQQGGSYFQFKTGGLADFTGPAWLDGTPSKPEYILNAKQTERFFSLVDVLEGYDTKASNTNNKNEISVDVDINVENISNDYDVEQMANKIRSMLYDDAMYRNVNNINLTR